MRQFRGLTKEGKWVYGWYLEKEDSHFNTYSVIVFGRHFEVIPKSVGQFTGLEDKNGKEIYEGDIIRFTTNDKDFKTATIEFQEHCYHAGFFPDKSTNGACWWEIIGNIHQTEEQDNARP